MASETSPLLSEMGDGFHGGSEGNAGKAPAFHNHRDHHSHFCSLIGIPTEDKSDDTQFSDPTAKTLYKRAVRKRHSQSMTYGFTAALSNTLLLSQVVLGAALTALGASNSSHVLITIFGVLNTVIAGLVAYLKSRGQPMRARMFRDDLDHVVDEIENSKTMWLGIKHDVHGYDEIDIEDKVSVRSEVARLTRLYESAVKKYMANNPDIYNPGGGVLDPILGLKARPAPGVSLPPIAAATAGGANGVAAPEPAAPPQDDADESPATAKDKPKTEEQPNDKSEDKSGDKDQEVKDKDQGKDKDKAVDSAASDDKKPDVSAKDKPEDNDPDAEPASSASPPKKEVNSKASVDKKVEAKGKENAKPST